MKARNLVMLALVGVLSLGSVAMAQDKTTPAGKVKVHHVKKHHRRHHKKAAAASTDKK